MDEEANAPLIFHPPVDPPPYQRTLKVTRPACDPQCRWIVLNLLAMFLFPYMLFLTLPGLILGVLAYVEHRMDDKERAKKWQRPARGLAIGAWLVGFFLTILGITFLSTSYYYGHKLW